MNRAWPALPLLLMAIAVIISASGVWISALPLPPESQPAASHPPAAELVPASPAPSDIRFWPPEQRAELSHQILGRSPFSPQRAAFVRHQVSDDAILPQYEPRLLGITGRGATAKALIQWAPGQPPQTVIAGDTTYAGRIVSIGSHRVTIAHGEDVRVIDMFAD